MAWTFKETECIVVAQMCPLITLSSLKVAYGPMTLSWHLRLSPSVIL